ncbi:MAG: protein kinase [Anaerolineales bacterium]|nr:protein kinase [Anaerolineales bacterium]
MSQIAPGSIIGPYTIIEELPQGRGGMAVVCKASIQLPRKPPYLVALKVMRSESKSPQEERFFSDAINNEVQILKHLIYPNIVRIYRIPLGGQRAFPVIARDSNLPGSPWYFVMEYLDGGSLQAMLKKRGKIPLEEAIEIGCQIGLALAYMHSKGIAHRDLKPDNVLFRTHHNDQCRIEPVLVDFGIAAKLERIGLQAGSIFYMSPERLQVVRGEVPPERVSDQAAGDVYGLGAIIYQMLTGRRPFEGRSKDHVTTAILHSQPTLPRKHNPEIPPQVEQVIMQALSKSPIRRPTADQFIASLEQLVPAPRLLSPKSWENPSSRSGSAVPWFFSVVSTAGLIGLLTWNITTGAFTKPTPTIAIPPTHTATIAPTKAPTEIPAATNTKSPTPTIHSQFTSTASPTKEKVATERATPTPVPTKPTSTPRPRQSTSTPSEG